MQLDSMMHPRLLLISRRKIYPLHACWLLVMNIVYEQKLKFEKNATHI
jgi:hypothetical protein